MSNKTNRVMGTMALVGAVMMGTASASRADLTLNGAVGLPLNPTAQLPERGRTRIQANFGDLGNISGGDLNIGGIYAASRVSNRLEVNGGLERVNGDKFLNPLDKTNIAVGAKYLVRSAGTSGSGTAVAVGVGHSRTLLRNTYAYAVATRPMGALTPERRAPGTIHLGVRYDDFDALGVIPGRSSGRASVYGGAEVPLDTRNRVSLVGELQSKNSSFGTSSYPYSLGVRVGGASPNSLSARVGFQREGITGRSGIYGQVGKAF